MLCWLYGLKRAEFRRGRWCLLRLGRRWSRWLTLRRLWLRLLFLRRLWLCRRSLLWRLRGLLLLFRFRLRFGCGRLLFWCGRSSSSWSWLLVKLLVLSSIELNALLENDWIPVLLAHFIWVTLLGLCCRWWCGLGFRCRWFEQIRSRLFLWFRLSLINNDRNTWVAHVLSGHHCLVDNVIDEVTLAFFVSLTSESLMIFVYLVGIEHGI